MNKTIVISLYFLLPLFVLNCHSEQVDKKLDSTATVSTQKNHRLNFLSDVKAISEDGAINAALLAASIIANTNPVIKKNLNNLRLLQTKSVKKKPK